MQNQTNVTKQGKIPYVAPKTEVLQLKTNDLLYVSGTVDNPTEADKTSFVEWDNRWN